MKKDIKLIAVDLDGTLLNSDKIVTERSIRALTLAAERGIEIVISTGRLFSTVPHEVHDLPFIRYLICVNGSRVVDKKTGKTLYQAEIPCKRAVEVMRMLDDVPCIYDCYIDGKGWMSKDLYEKIDEYGDTEYVRNFIRTSRTPVDDLKQYLIDRGEDVQKVQLFLRTYEDQDIYRDRLRKAFADLVVCSSFSTNVELNSADATKGKALTVLCDHLGVDTEKVAAFGDADNDVTMFEAVGVGVAMGNAFDSVKQAAFTVTTSCDEDGVAKFIEEYIL